MTTKAAVCDAVDTRDSREITVPADVAEGLGRAPMLAGACAVLWRGWLVGQRDLGSQIGSCHQVILDSLH